MRALALLASIIAAAVSDGGWIGSGTIDAHVGGVITYYKGENVWSLVLYDSRADAGVRDVMVPYRSDGGCRIEYTDGGSRVDHSRLCEEIKLISHPVADSYRAFFGGEP